MSDQLRQSVRAELVHGSPPIPPDGGPGRTTTPNGCREPASPDCDRFEIGPLGGSPLRCSKAPQRDD
jgi:hypothetical protein